MTGGMDLRVKNSKNALAGSMNDDRTEWAVALFALLWRRVSWNARHVPARGRWTRKASEAASG